MQTLRHFTLLTRLVLGCFVLSLGAAVASPIVSPQNLLLVCTASGSMQILVQDDDGSATEMGSHGLDCPLCATLSAPPPIVGAVAQSVRPLAYALQSVPAACVVARSTSPHHDLAVEHGLGFAAEYFT
ncbi:MAG: hypothetical protein WCH60_19795, partial [Burkholderiales bacterium]